MPTLAPILVSTAVTSQPAPRDNSAKSTFRRGWVIILLHLGLHELDIIFVGPDGDEAQAAAPPETIESLRSRPAVIEHDIPVAIVPAVVRDGHLPRGRANAEEFCHSPKVGGLGGRLPITENGSSGRCETQVAESHLLHGGPSVDLRGTDAGR